MAFLRFWRKFTSCSHVKPNALIGVEGLIKAHALQTGMVATYPCQRCGKDVPL
jgi:hypothetical protein